MIIEVTQEDIDKGWQENGQFCAIARAIKRDHPELDEIDVTLEGVYENGEQVNIVYRTTKKMAEFIKNFDRKRNSVKPTKFRLIKEK